MILPTRANQRRSSDFVSDALSDDQRLHVLCIVDDCTREALAAVVDRSMAVTQATMLCARTLLTAEDIQ